ncbi:MAG: hydrogenase, partial [Lentisphaerota bacterium]
AIGQTVDSKKILDGIDVKLKSNGCIEANPVSCQTSEAWIFAGGDAVSGPSSVVEAVGAGEKAAVGIDQFLTGEKHAFWRGEKTVNTAFDPDADPEPYKREKLPLISTERRRNNFDEVELPWNEAVAIRQSKRCLRCDYGKKTVGTW